MYNNHKRYKRGRTTIRLSTSDLRKDTADALNRAACGGDRIALHRRGKDVAVIVTVKDFLRALEDREDMEPIRKIRAESSEEVLRDDLEKELGL